MDDSPAIELKALSKRYQGSDKFALHKVSLTVAPGEVYGFLGANGAGKSTTIRCLLNFIQPTEGSAILLGRDSVKQRVEVKKHVGYLAGDVALYNKMTGKRFLAYMSSLQPLKRPNYLKTLTRVFRAELNRPMDILSKGNRQKIALIQALMHDPDILVLDEPTSGLDPLMQEEFFTVIREAKARGAAVFLSSHNLTEIRRICDRVGFVRDGKLVAETSLAELAQNAAHTFSITFSTPAPLKELSSVKRAVVTPSPDPKHVTVRLQGGLPAFFGVLSHHKVLQLEQREVDLEEQFLRLYGKDKK